MQIKQIMLAVVATLAVGQAVAGVTPAQIATQRASGVLQETWISGASAPTFNIYQGFVAGCDAGTQTVFTNSTSTTAAKPGSTGNFNAYACVRGGNGDAVVDAGEVITLAYHTVDGGSFNAFAPHVSSTVPLTANDGPNLRRLVAVDNSNCLLSPAVFAGNTVYRSCGLVNPSAASVLTEVTAALKPPVNPAGGFSDVEAALWGVDASVAGTSAPANIGQVFGVVVNPNLYRAMQVSQGIYASLAAANTADAEYDPANAPNITSAQYTSIATGAYQTNFSPIVTGSTEPINLARRAPSSGTQSSSNAFFLKNPCNGEPAILGALSPAGSGDTVSGAFIVTEGSGTGNVKTTLGTVNTANDFAIGIMSVENDWRTETAANGAYRFVKLDGVHPEAGSWDGVTLNSNGTKFYTARKTAANGEYAFHMELVSFVANTADAVGAALIPTIVTALGNPASCSDLPRGLTLNPLGGSSCAVGVEVAKGSRFGNNCQAQQLFF